MLRHFKNLRSNNLFCPNHLFLFESEGLVTYILAQNFVMKDPPQTTRHFLSLAVASKVRQGLPQGPVCGMAFQFKNDIKKLPEYG